MAGSTANAYSSWPVPARTMAVAIDAGVSAAQAGDAAAFADALGVLSRLDAEQRIVLLGSVTRDLLERSHPDGLDAEGAQEVIDSCVKSAGWYPGLAPDALVAALTGALGIFEEGAPQFDELVVQAHGVLLIAAQLSALGQDLPPVLTSALQELRRSQTVELP